MRRRVDFFIFENELKFGLKSEEEGDMYSWKEVSLVNDAVYEKGVPFEKADQNNESNCLWFFSRSILEI